MPATNLPIPAVVEQVMQADRYRLRRWWRKLQRSRQSTVEIEKWHTAAEKSAATRQARAAAVPALSFDPELPISAHREEIVELLRNRQTIVVCGETGSGKSTQLPKLCLEAGLGLGGMIGHTQPRRLAARAIASRLAEELSSRVGEAVGFKVRFTDKTKPRETLVKLMTDGVLLAETQSDRFLDQYDALIIDEAHERSLNIDFLLGYIRNISAKRPDLKLIITSATIDPERFAEHFRDEQGPAPIIEVSGRGYPVDIVYRPMEADDEGDDELDLPRAIAHAIDEIQQLGPGDVLTFLPTERDIRRTAKYLRGHLTRGGIAGSIEVLPLYARLSQAEQNRIFATHSKRRIILSTNVAESSLTVPGIHYVVDSGLVRISRYAPRSKVTRLPIEPISQASANQRAGRCGRLGPGTCIRLYALEDYERRPKFTTPEIRRTDLASVLLQSLVLKLGPLTEFPLLDPPTPEGLRDGERTLQELGALDEGKQLSKIGRKLGALPCDPRIGRMLIEANERNCLEEVTIIAAALEGQDVRQRPSGKQAQADEAHRKFLDPHSDFLSYIRLWDFFQHLRADLGRSRLQRALNQNFLSLQGFREWADIVRQLREMLSTANIARAPASAGWKRRLELNDVDPNIFDRKAEQAARQRSKRSQGPAPNNRNSRSLTAADNSENRRLQRPKHYAAIHQSLLTGLLSMIAQRGDRNEYQATRGLKIFLWPGSGLFLRQPKWIMTAEVVETTKRFGRTVAEVDIEWIEKAGQELLKHSYNDPHWSRKTGSAMVYRRSTLYGLPIVAARRVPLPPLDADTSRSLLIEHGLVGGEWNCQESFYLHNEELLKDLHEVVQRTRSNDFIVDRFHLMNFYNERLPTDVVDLNSLRACIKKHKGSEQERALWMEPNDLISEHSNVDRIGELYPNALQLGPAEFPLNYNFEPGTSHDGVVVTIPQAALGQVSDGALGWLVPGLLEEKVLQLIRSLPKQLRTCFVPAPDVAKQISEELLSTDKSESFIERLCQLLCRHSGEKIRRNDFNTDKLSSHLKFLVRVVNDQGEVIEESRNLEDLQRKYTLPAVANEALASDSPSEWNGQTITPENFDCLPEQIQISKGGVRVAAFPVLKDMSDHVETGVVDTAALAMETNLVGFTRLFAIQYHRSLRSHVAHLPGVSDAQLKIAKAVPTDLLRSNLQDLIAKVALVESQPVIRDRLSLEARNANAGQKISVAAQELALWLPKFANAYHDLRLRIEEMPGSWREVRDDAESQLAEFFPERFLILTPWKALQEFPRYLNAMLLRIEKLGSGGLPKDRALRSSIDQLWHRFVILREERTTSSEELEKFRWLLEEYRVSVFAQQLGTKEKVSEKRLTTLLDTIETG